MFNKRIFNVFNSYFKVNGVTVLANENLTSASISRTVQEAIIKNGIANKTWSKLEYDAELNIEMASNVMSFEQIAMSCGSAIVEGVTTDYTMAEKYDVEGNAIELKEIPLNEDELEIVDIATDKLIESSGYSVSGKSVTFTPPTTEGVKVLPYKYTAQNASKITISSDKFSEAGELVLETYAVDNQAKITDKVTIVIHKAKPSSNFTIATSADVSSGKDNTTTVVALDNEGSFGEIILTPVA